MMVIIYLNENFSGYAFGFDSEFLFHYRAFDNIKSIYVANSQGFSGISYLWSEELASLVSPPWDIWLSQIPPSPMEGAI